MSNEIQLYQKLNAADLLPIGREWANSGMFGCSKAEQGPVILMTCITEGISPIQYIRTYDTVDGKPRKKAMAALAEFRMKGGKVKWLKTGDEAAATEDAREAAAEFTFEGQSVTVRFSISDAKRMGLIRDKSNWVKSPGNMLRARVSSTAVGMLAPEIFAGDDRDDEQPAATTSAPALDLGKMKSAAAEPPPASPAAPPPPPAAPFKPTIVEAEVVAESPAPVATTPASNELDAETVKQVESIMFGTGDDAAQQSNFERAMKYLLDKGHIKQGQRVADLSPVFAAKIVKNPAGFQRAVQPGK